MTVSFVLRLLPDRLRCGDVVGQVEHVASRECETVADIDSLVAFLRRSTAEGEPNE